MQIYCKFARFFQKTNLAMRKLKITQVKSKIDRPARQKRTLIALGITRMNQSVEVVETPQIKGMIDAVKHLLLVEEL